MAHSTAMSNAIVESPMNNKKVLSKESSARKLLANTARVISNTGNSAMKKLENVLGIFLVAVVSSGEKREDAVVLIFCNSLPSNGPAMITVGMVMINP